MARPLLQLQIRPRPPLISTNKAMRKKPICSETSRSNPNPAKRAPLPSLWGKGPGDGGEKTLCASVANKIMYHARQHAIPTKSSLRLFQGPCRGEPWLARFCNYKSARGRPSSAPIKQCVKSPSVAKLPDQIPIPPNALPSLMLRNSAPRLAGGPRGARVGGGVGIDASVAKKSCHPAKTQNPAIPRPPALPPPQKLEKHGAFPGLQRGDPGGFAGARHAWILSAGRAPSGYRYAGR